MWYFAWVLGASLAVLLAIFSGMQCEARECAMQNKETDH